MINSTLRSDGFPQRDRSVLPQPRDGLCKAAMDAGAMIRSGSIVTAIPATAICSGFGSAGWANAGLRACKHSPRSVFHRFLAGAGEPDMGDSAITETFGIGGAAMMQRLA